MIRFRKILLFNPPNVEQGGYTPSPLGLLYLAGYLRKNKKLKIKVVDAARLGKRSAIDALKNLFQNVKPSWEGFIRPLCGNS